MSDPLEQKIIAIIQDTLREQCNGQQIAIAEDDSMETVVAWDSLSFMSVFETINEAFGVSPDFDDAIHYTSVRTLHSYLKEKVD
jgi:acyl carrier protein